LKLIWNLQTLDSSVVNFYIEIQFKF